MPRDGSWKVGAAARMTTLLSDAMNAVAGDRMEDYGAPSENYKRIAGLWNSYFHCDFPDKGRDLNEIDAVVLMILTKIARLVESPDHYDSWKDIAGYAAVGWAVSSAPEGEKKDEPTLRKVE